MHPTKHSRLLANGLGIICLCTVLAGAAHAADWPQWRGPDRDGVAPQSPALADSWSAEGPPQVWQSEKIPSGQKGNLSCPIVSGGKVFLYVTWEYKAALDTRRLSEANLHKLGWFPETLPDVLKEAVEAARLSEERAGLPRGEVPEWVNAWVEKQLVSEEQKKLAAVVRDRLERGRNALPFEFLDKLTSIKDRAFTSQAELDDWLTKNGIEGKLRKTLLDRVPTTKDMANDVVLCLDATNGKTLWKAEFPGSATGYNFSSTPCVADNRLYVLASSRYAYCLDAENGRVIWKRHVPGAANVSSSFLVAEGLAVILSGSLTALDAESGEVKWTQPKISGSNPSPILMRAGDRLRVVCNAKGGIGCADLLTGEHLWKVPGGGSSTTVISGDLLTVFSTQKPVGLTAYRLRADKAEKAWSIELTDRGSSPVMADGYVHAVGGRGSARIVCVKADSGEVAWEEEIESQEISSPILADGKIIGVLDDYWSLAMWRATPEGFDLLAKAKMPLAACTSPALADGKLYVRLKNAVACYDLRKGESGE